MSYCRKNRKDSSVYVYATIRSNGELLECTCGKEGHNLTRKEMVLHLVNHLRSGDKVPQRTFERLMNEMLEGKWVHSF